MASPLYPGLSQRVQNQYIPGVSPLTDSQQGGGYTLNSPILQQQAAALEQQILNERAAQLQQQYGFTQKRADLNQTSPPGYYENVNYTNMDVSGGYPTASKGSRTGLTPAGIGRAMAQYDNGTYRGNASDLYADAADLSSSASAMADKAYSAATGGSSNGDASSSVARKQKALENQRRNQAELAWATRGAVPVQLPSYSGNPAGGYTNVTQLGPVNQGPVTIANNKPADVGWGTGSSYDPNTGLSKWATTGLNGENYYNNYYAGLYSDEAARKNAQAAEAAAFQQQQSAGFQRQDMINQVVDSLVAGGMDKSMARVQARNLSDAELSSQIAAADTAAQQPQNDQLNALLQQFANPNYGGGNLNQPLVYSQAQQAPAYTQDMYTAAVTAAQNNPNLSQAERNQAISEASRAFRDSRAAQQNSSTGNSVQDINQQYQQAVQQQQNQAAQQQQQQLAQQFQQAMDQANATNQARYEDAIAGYQQNQQNISDYLTNQGQQQQEDIGRQYDRFNSRNTQDLINRGLGNTTVLNATQRGIEEDRGRALRNSQEQIDRQRLQYETAAQQNLLNFMERRTDQAPDYGQLANLAQGLGTTGGGSVGSVGNSTNPTVGGTGAVPAYTNPANGQTTGAGQNPTSSVDYSHGPFQDASRNQEWFNNLTPENQSAYAAQYPGQQTPAAGAGTGSPTANYNPIFNTPQQQQPQQPQQPQRPAMGTTPGYGMQADGTYVTPPDQRNMPGQGATGTPAVGANLAGVNVGAQGVTGANRNYGAQPGNPTSVGAINPGHVNYNKIYNNAAINGQNMPGNKKKTIQLPANASANAIKQQAHNTGLNTGLW